MADSEFEKKMKLLDPSYVVPMNERVKNRQPIDFKSEAPAKNEAGLEFHGDSPVDANLQQMYIDRMMDKDSLTRLEEIEKKQRNK